MSRHLLARCWLPILVLVTAQLGAAAGKVEGTFVVGGTDASLKFVRAVRTKLDDKGKTGYAILLSAHATTISCRVLSPSSPLRFMRNRHCYQTQA